MRIKQTLLFTVALLTVTNAFDIKEFVKRFGGGAAIQELERQTKIHKSSTNPPTPVVLWHGMGDDCCHAFSMGAIKKLIESQIPGVYVLSLCIGNNIQDTSQCNQVTDTMNGFLGDVNSQIEYACEVVKNDEN